MGREACRRAAAAALAKSEEQKATFNEKPAGKRNKQKRGRWVMEGSRQGSVDRNWYGVRCLIHDSPNGLYEERVTLWDAASMDEAIDKALNDAREYASSLGVNAADFAQAYRLPGLPSLAGDEVFSLIRRCELVADDYVAQFFDTGRELRNVDRRSWSWEEPCYPLAPSCAD